MTTENKLVLKDLLGFENIELNNSKDDLLLETISKNHNKIGELDPVVESLLEVISRTNNKIGEAEF